MVATRLMSGPHSVALFIFCICIILSHDTIEGKKTKSPSSSPSTIPSLTPSLYPTLTMLPSAQPSLYPTHSPTAFPSPLPSQAPTSSPSSSPSIAPTAMPSPTPTANPTPELEPSLFPTDEPTRKTSPPTDTPTTSSPTEAPKGEIGIQLPMISFDVTVSGRIYSYEEMESMFVDFLDKILIEGSTTYRLDYSHIESNAIVSMPNEYGASESEYRINIDGLAFYYSDAPTVESLEQILKVYFSFWGASELDDYLEEVTSGNAKIRRIAIDDEELLFLPDEVGKNSPQSQLDDPGSDTQGDTIENKFYNEEAKLSKPAIIGLYVGLVLFVVTVVLLVARHRIVCKQKLEGDERSLSSMRIGKERAAAKTYTETAPIEN